MTCALLAIPPINAEFEDHAEHEYMLYMAEHPELAGADPGQGVRDEAMANVRPSLRQ